MSPRYQVTLTTEERKELEALTRNGKTTAKNSSMLGRLSSVTLFQIVAIPI